MSPPINLTELRDIAERQHAYFFGSDTETSSTKLLALVDAAEAAHATTYLTPDANVIELARNLHRALARFDFGDT